jgi:iron complex outermembrane receptor protein
MKQRITPLPLVLLFLLGAAFAQQPLKGRVLDAQSTEPVIGAIVRVNGTQAGAITDNEGNFQIKTTVKPPILLRVTSIGYQAQEVNWDGTTALTVALAPAEVSINEVVVLARRRSEEIQEIPLAVAVIGGKEISNSVSFNVNRVKELVPSVQLYSSNPRNTTLNIRGLGSTFGLTNDGIDPGVGFYVDGVYYARPAATTLDFIDVQQIEVLRGPQGTLFGKNTTAGAFNITSRRSTLTQTGVLEQTFGNYGFIQTKGSISGPLIKDKLLVRLSYSGTHRDGNIYNVRTEKFTNSLNNQGVKGQLLWLAGPRTSFTLMGDYTRQRPDGYAQVFAGVTQTQRPAWRQFESILEDLDYTLPSRNPFDRLIDHDTPWRSDQDMGGVSLNAETTIGQGKLVSTTAWRTWIWGPSNDRDFTGLQALAISQAPSIHNQWSQEVRYSGEINRKLSGVVGVFAFYQDLRADGAHREESGVHQWRFVQNNQDPLWQTPGLLEGFGIETRPNFRNFSGAVFSQLDWKVTNWLTLLPGLRVNYDQKAVEFSRTTYGGLETTNQALLALKSRVYTNQQFEADITNENVSGQLSALFRLHEKVRVFTTASLAFKPVGLNLGGLPTENGQPLVDLAVIKPERVYHYEIGLKSEPIARTTLNLTVFNTDVFDYQTTVQVAELGVNRGYLANAEQVRVRSAELELGYLGKNIRLNGSFSYNDGVYVSFVNAPVPLEETGGANFKDISGEVLPGISKWNGSFGGEVYRSGGLIGIEGRFFAGLDGFFRSSFSSSPSASSVLFIDGYTLLNARLGFEAQKGLSIFVWGRNIADTEYFEQLLPGAGNIGHYAAVLGDPRTFGVTLRYNL